MTSLHCSSSMNDLNSMGVRRSDRKKTKKIFKDDFLLPNPFKGKSKKLRSVRLPQNLDLQIKRIQFLTERTLEMLNYGKQEFSIEMLTQMKQAVNQQQTKLSEFMEITLVEEISMSETRIASNIQKNRKIPQQRGNTPKLDQNSRNMEYQNEVQYHKDLLGIATAQQIYDQYHHNIYVCQDEVSAFDEKSQYCLDQVPRIRKQSYKLLSDNYENHELMYNIEHIIPNWHKQDHQLHEQHQFLG